MTPPWRGGAFRSGQCLASVLIATGCGDFATIGIFPALDGGDQGSRSAGGDAGPSLPVLAISDCESGNAAGLDLASGQSLTAEGSGDAGAMRWLYPYDGTVFPGGIQAPLLMWDGPTDGGIYVRLRSDTFDYQGCFKPSAPGQLQFPQYAWEAAQSPAGIGSGHFAITLANVESGRVTATVSEQVVIANEKLPATVYYMTIGSGAAVSAGGVTNVGQSTVLRLQPGQAAQPVFATTFCTGCHSVSARGGTLIDSAAGSGTSYSVTGAASAPTVVSASTPGGEFPGITPDGALYVAAAHPGGVGPRSYGASAQNTSALFETATGATVGDSGVPTGVLTPSFSPDGTALVFNDYALASGRGLAFMAFSAGARRASNYRALYTDSQNYPAWPTFLPDQRGVVFSLGAASDFSGGAAGVFGVITPGPATDLYLVDVTTGAALMLAQAMGFRTVADLEANATYLPFGAADLHQNYYPSTFPVASGGYHWVFFDSRRNYGNLGALRQIWGAALDIAANGSYSVDPSHPAFYLPGQELGPGNFRAVAVVDR